MEPVGTHGLACLSDTDWADFARYMECQAETIDQLLFDRQTELEDFLSRPTMILRPSAVRTFAAGTISNLFNEVVYVNNSFMSLTSNGSGTETYISIGSPVGTAVTAYERGMYLAGIQVPFDATGAVTAFSERRATISVLDDTIPPDQTQLAFAYDLSPDAGTTITNVTVNAHTSVVLRGTNGVRVAHAVAHTNAASTVSITLNTDCLLWVTYLGPDELVEVT